MLLLSSELNSLDRKLKTIYPELTSSTLRRMHTTPQIKWNVDLAQLGAIYLILFKIRRKHANIQSHQWAMNMTKEVNYWFISSNDASVTHLHLLLCWPHSFLSVLFPVSRVKHCGQKSESSKWTGSEWRWEPLKIKNLYAEAWGCVRIAHICASGAATASTSIPSSGGIFAATGGERGHTYEQEEMQECKREGWEHREQEENTAVVEAEGSVEWKVARGFCVPRCCDDVNYI